MTPMWPRNALGAAKIVNIATYRPAEERQGEKNSRPTRQRHLRGTIHVDIECLDRAILPEHIYCERILPSEQHIENILIALERLLDRIPSAAEDEISPRVRSYAVQLTIRILK